MDTPAESIRSPEDPEGDIIPLTGAEVFSKQNLLAVEDNPQMEPLTYGWFVDSGLQERICSYMRSLAEICREEMALREQWQKLLRRIEVGGTND